MKLRIDNSFIRFLLVGILNTFVGLSSMLLLLNVFEFNYFVSTSLGNVFGAIVSYFLNRSYTFKSQVEIKKSLGKFCLITVISYIFSYSISYILALKSLEWSTVSLNENVANNLSVLAGSIIYTLSNYFGHRFYTFKFQTETNFKTD